MEKKNSNIFLFQRDFDLVPPNTKKKPTHPTGDQLPDPARFWIESP